jgi:acetylglutamate kinase
MPGVTVVKVGGNEVDSLPWVAALAEALARRGGRAVVVHGGGKEVSALQRTLGAEPEWRDGLRVTTPEAMRAVAMVLTGVVNKRLVSALLGAGVDAVGISGVDGALLRAELLRGGALGRTGEVAQVRAELLHAWLAQGITPVLSPVSRGPDGEPLNVNADDAAAAVAGALRAAELLFLSDVPGVRDGGSIIPALGPEDAEELISGGVASGGMAPKLRAAVRAAGRVGRVRIGGVEMLDDPGAGTRVRLTRAPAGYA